ncbi:hypothetical protein HQ576_07125 [bacterium]|nr:hypothetical protein [bacterium]
MDRNQHHLVICIAALLIVFGVGGVVASVSRGVGLVKESRRHTLQLRYATEAGRRDVDRLAAIWQGERIWRTSFLVLLGVVGLACVIVGGKSLAKGLEAGTLHAIELRPTFVIVLTALYMGAAIAVALPSGDDPLAQIEEPDEELLHAKSEPIRVSPGPARTSGVFVRVDTLSPERIDFAVAGDPAMRHVARPIRPKGGHSIRVWDEIAAQGTLAELRLEWVGRQQTFTLHELPVVLRYQGKSTLQQRVARPRAAKKAPKAEPPYDLLPPEPEPKAPGLTLPQEESDLASPGIPLRRVEFVVRGRWRPGWSLTDESVERIRQRLEEEAGVKLEPRPKSEK